jgi:4'-phosphopantetheinyl transferase
MPQTLSAGAVHLWLCEVDSVEDPQFFCQVLNADELQRCQRFPEQYRSEAILTRALLRASLSRYDQVDPADWEFSIAEHGKPAISSPSSSLAFNVSHSEGWIVCAVSVGMELGVDLQFCDPDRKVGRLARRFFSEAEAVTLSRRSDSEQRELFYDLWTLKEARTKAAGGAIAAGLGRYGFDLSKSGIINADNPDASHFLWELTPHHRLALCVPGQSLAVSDIQIYRALLPGNYQQQELLLRAAGGLVIRN